MNFYRGTGVALVTPFNEKGEIDEISLRQLVREVIQGGVDYLVALGTTSEAATLTEAERLQVLTIILEENQGRLPVMVGIGGNNTAEVLKNIRNFPFVKECCAVLSVTPYYNKPSQEGLYRHFKTLSESSPLPVFLYNVPGRTGVNMSAQTVVRLAQDCPGIVGVKEASGNFEQATEILKYKRKDFAGVSGDEGLTLPLMSIGMSGVISVAANVCPVEFSTLVRLANEGNFGAAVEIHLRLSDLCKALFIEGNPTGIKAALQVKGTIRSNCLRLPLVEASEGLCRHLKALLQELKSV